MLKERTFPSQKFWATKVLVSHLFKPRPVCRAGNRNLTTSWGLKVMLSQRKQGEEPPWGHEPLNSDLLTCSEWQQLTSVHPCLETLCPSSHLHRVTFFSLHCSSAVQKKTRTTSPHQVPQSNGYIAQVGKIPQGSCRNPDLKLFISLIISKSAAHQSPCCKQTL